MVTRQGVAALAADQPFPTVPLHRTTVTRLQRHVLADPVMTVTACRHGHPAKLRGAAFAAPGHALLRRVDDSDGTWRRTALEHEVIPMMTDTRIVVVPANEASWHDIQTVFGTRGDAFKCQCQRYKLAPGEGFASFPVADRADRLRQQTHCDTPGSPTTSGLLAYRDDVPVGWCAVAPRTTYPGLARVYRVPWLGRAEEKTDASVWAVTCLVTRSGFRKRGVSRALARAAVDFARARGARALEAYPMLTQPG